MEVKKVILDKLKEQSGSTLFVSIGLMAAMITLFLVIYEVFNVVGIYNSVTTNMERASNMAIEYAMIDEARGYHISIVDAEVAEDQFGEYFVSRLGLNGNYEKIEDGSLNYKVTFDTYEIDPDKAQMLLAGDLVIDLKLVGNYVPTPVSLPFSIRTRNVNAAD